MQSQTSMQQNNTRNNIGNAAPPSARGTSHLKILPKRRLTQRFSSNGNPQSKCDVQIDEINKLTSQLAHYKNQYQKIVISRIQQEKSKKDRGGSHLIHNQTLSQLLLSSEQYRNELMAAQQKRKQLFHQNIIFQKQLEHILQERNSLITQITNQRSKNSILDQELFMIKDSFSKYQNASQAEKYGLLSQLNNAKANYHTLEQQMIGLAQKANLLPIIQHKNKENELRVQGLIQQNLQIKTELKYYLQKSNYFESNYNVLNQNFNSLYNINLNLNKDLNETKTIKQTLQSSIKVLQQEHKTSARNYSKSLQQRDKLVDDLNSHLGQLIAKLKDQQQKNKISTQKHASIQYQLANAKKQLELKIESLSKQIIKHQQTIHKLQQVNFERNSIIKQLQLSIQRKEQYWKNTLNNEIVKMTNQFGSKVINISTQLIKSQQSNKTLLAQIKKYHQETIILKQQYKQVSSQLSKSKQALSLKEQNIINLQSKIESAKQKQSSSNNCLNEYENKLKSILTVQQQVTHSNRLIIQQKNARIKDLQQLLRQQSKQKAKIQSEYHDLSEQTAKIKQIINLLKAQLQYEKDISKELQEKIQEYSKKFQWLNDQNMLKQQLITKYNCVTEDMRQQISIYHQEINNLNSKNKNIQEENNQKKELIQQKQALIKSQLLIISQQSTNYQTESQNCKNSIDKLKQLNYELSHNNKELNQKVANLSLNFFLKNQQQANMASLCFLHNQKLQNYQAQNSKLQQQINCTKITLQQINKQKYNQNCISKAQIQMLNQTNSKLNSQITYKSQQIKKVIQQREQLSKLIQQKICIIEDFKRYIIKLDEQYKNGIQQNKKIYQDKINSVTNIFKDQQKNFQQQKKQLQNGLHNLSVAYQNTKIHLQSQKMRTENLTLENSLLRKSLQEMQESLTVRFQREITTLTQHQNQQLSKLHKSIQILNDQRKELILQIQNISKQLRQKNIQVQNSLQISQKLRQSVQKDRAQIELLQQKVAQTQIQNKNLLQSSEHDNKVKNTLSNSMSALQMKNVLLEQYMLRSRVEVDQIHKILSQLKEEKQILVQKYLSLADQIFNIKQKNFDVRSQLDGFAQYFNTVSKMHCQISQHINNINQLAQPNTIRVYSTFSQSRMDESIVDRVHR